MQHMLNLRPRKTAMKVVIFVMLLWLLLPLSASLADVDEDVSCSLTPRQTSYASGESIQFRMQAQMSLIDASSAGNTVTLGIPIPETTPACTLPMFRYKGTEAGYEGLPMYPVSYQGNTIYMYLVTLPNGSRRIEFTLRAGDTLQTSINISLPNGLTAPISAFTLTPEVIGGTYTPTKANLQGGTTSVTAQFGWDNVQKTQSEESLGSISQKEKDSIVYTISASSRSSAQATGCVFTDHYVVTDTLLLNGMGFTNGAKQLIEESGLARYTVGGVTVLEFNVPMAGLTITPHVDGRMITGFDIAYAVQNTTLDNASTAKELSNLRLNVTVKLNPLQSTVSGEASMVNTATLDAYSALYDEAAGRTGAGYHHHSTASVTAYASDAYEFTKEIFLDPDCTVAAPRFLQNGTVVYYRMTAHNESSAQATFTITDDLPEGMVYVSAVPSATASGQTVTWQQVSIPAGGYARVVLCAKVDASKLSPDNFDLINIARLTKDGALLGIASVHNVYRTDDNTDGQIVYSKTADNASPGVNDPLTYTIVASNPQATNQLITVVDNWPGAYIRPTKVTGCTYYEFFDAAGTSYTLEQLTQNPAIVIKTVKFYDIAIPAKGKVTLKITGVITNPTDVLVNQVGAGSAGSAQTESYGLGITKRAYSYDASAHTISQDPLSVSTPTKAGEIVCFKIGLTNKTDHTIGDVQVEDTLPAGLTLVDVEYQGVTAQAMLVRGASSSATVSALTLMSTSPVKTVQISLAGGESAAIYLFVRVEDAAIAAAKTSGYRIINTANATFSNLRTPAATASIFTPYDDVRRTLGMSKDFILSCNLAEDFTYLGTNNINYMSTAEPTLSTYMGAYNLYRVLMMAYPETASGGTPVRVYEFTDVLPEGMEFVGVATVGSDRDFFNLAGLESNPTKLCGKILRAGETGLYTTVGGASYNFTPEYDAATRTLRIVINDGNAPYYQVQPRVNSATRNYIMMITRTTELRDTYVNSFTAKVDKEIHNLAPVKEDLDGPYNFLTITNTIASLQYVPGITKLYTGSDTAEPSDILDWQLQVKSEDHSNLPSTSAIYGSATATAAG